MLRNPLINTPLQRGLEFGHFLPVSRSETTMVAVGLSPRTTAKHRFRRRGATPERLILQPRAFKRRYATRLFSPGSPWAEAHGYRQLPLCGKGGCATCPMPRFPRALLNQVPRAPPGALLQPKAYSSS